MAVLVVLDSAMSAKQYDACAAVLGDALPEGCSEHIAGPRPEGGWRMAMVWDSPDRARQYLHETLTPALVRAGVKARATSSFSQIHRRLG